MKLGFVAAAFFHSGLLVAAPSVVLASDIIPDQLLSSHSINHKTLVIIDSDVPDKTTLLRALPDHSDVINLTDRDTIHSLQAQLSTYRELDEIHLLTHGQPGQLALLGESIDGQTLHEKPDIAQMLGAVLSADGDILLYGCRVGQGDQGAEFIDIFSRLSGADIAASTDETGSYQKGGNWDLELHQGVISASLPFQHSLLNNYQGTLVSDTIDYTTEAATNNVNDHTVTASLTTSTQLTIDWGTGLQGSNVYTDHFVRVLGGAGIVPVDGGTLNNTDGSYFSDSTGGFQITADNAFSIDSMRLSRRASGGGTEDFTITGFKNNGQVVSDTLTWSLTNTGDQEVFTRGSGTWADAAAWQDIDKVVVSWPTTDLGGGEVAGASAYQEIAVVNYAVSDAVSSNNIPTVTGAPTDITVIEDTASNVDLSAVTFADADGDSLTVTLTASAGTFSTPADGSGISVTETLVNSTTITLAGTVANINTYLDTASNISYTGAANAAGNGSATLTIAASDGQASLASDPVVNIDITSVNDEPTLSIGSNQTAGNGTGGVQQSVNSFASMSDDGDTEATQSIADFIVSEASDTNNVVSAVDISNAGQLTYTPASGVDGTATINVQVQDNGGVANSGDDTSQVSQFTITVDTLAPALGLVTAVTSPTNDSTPSYTLSTNEAGTLLVGGSCGSASEGAVSSGNVTIALTQTDNSTPLTAGTYTDCTVTVTDSSGNTSSQLSIASFTVDLTAPSVQTLSPVDNATGISNSANLTLNFDEDIALGTGNISIHKTSDDSTVATLDVTSHAGQLSISNDVLTINPSSDLPTNTELYVLIDATAIDDVAGNSYSGIASTTSWSFTTADVAPPSVTGITISGSPNQTATSVTFVVAFNENANSVSTDDFELTTTGTASGNIASVSASSGSSVNVTVDTLTGAGTVRLDLKANTNITDDSGNGNNTNGYVSAYASGSSHTADLEGPTITAVSIPNTTHKVGDTVTATLTVASDSNDYTSGSGGISGTIDGYSLGSLSKTNDTTYTATFTITDGGTDVAAASNVAVNITLTDSLGNSGSAFTTAITQANDAIYANLPDVTLSTNISTIVEDGGVSTLTATLANSLNNQWPDAITVNLSYSGTATVTTDYTKSDSITITAGNSTGTSTVTSVADSHYDAAASETVIVDISSVSVGNEDGVQQKTISITDAESAPTVTLSVGNSTVAENGGTSNITATLSNATYEDVTVTLAYSGTASSGGTDYNTPSSSITITAGTTSATASTGITSVDDASAEGSETIVIDVSGVSGGGASESGTQQQTITVTDDEAVPVSLSISSSSLAENAGTSTITATLSVATFEDVTVSLGYSGTAINNTDYTSSGSITILAGQTTGAATLTATQDTLVEASETVVIDITGVSGGGAIEDGTQQQTVSITDDDVANVTLSVSNSTIAEASGTSTITVTLDQTSYEDVTVGLSYSGSATSATDYSTSSASITISAGQTTGTATVTATQDALVEGSETVIIDITSVNGGSASESGTQQETLSITDDETVSVSLSASSLTISEASGASTVTATLDQATFEDVTVTLGFSGTATSATDYSTSSASITILAGQTTGTATVTATQDSSVEASETIVIDITGVTGGTASENGTQQQTVSITDDDVASVTLSVSNSTIAEASGTSTITATLDQASYADVTVGLSYSGTSTSGVDYNSASNTITISAGQTSGTTTITAAQDALVEGSETVIIDISSVNGGSASESGTQQETLSITDDETVNVSLAVSNTTISEASGTSTITVTLDQTSYEDVTVGLSYSGSATSATDYSTSSVSITISAGQKTGTATVTATQDALVEGSETVIIDISSVNGGSASESGTQQETLSIIDDETVSVSLSVSSLSIAEASGISTVTAALDQATFEDVTVTLGYSGTATSATDYSTSSTSITISAGQTTGTATVTATQDTSVEASETIVIDITGVTGGAANENGIQQQTVSITDDDVANVTLSVSNSTIAEASGTSTITATLDQATFEDVIVSLGYSGTATSGTDYSTPSSSITITAGQTTGTAIVTATQDTSVEASETIVIDITGVTGGAASENGTQQQTVSITDDETVNVSLAVSSTTISEASGTSTITATLDQTTYEDVIVSLGYSGTATSGTDYSTPSSSITITAGQTSGTAVLSAIQDTDEESDETIIIDISGVTGGNASESGSQSQTVEISNDDNEAQADVASVNEDESVQIDVLANDVGNGAALNPASVQISVSANSGATSINTANGVITYTPEADFNGTDSFSYTVMDVRGNTSSNTLVNVTVVSVNDAPVAVNDTASVNEDESVVIDVVSNDTDVDGSADINPGSLAIADQPGNGSVVIENDKVTYTPDLNYFGSDTFTYTVNDNSGSTSSTGTVTVNVSGSNDAPVAVSDTSTTDEDTAVTITVLNNDSDIDSQLDVTSVTVVTNPVSGSVSVQADGSLIYSPTENFNGTDTFTYTVKDADDAVSAQATVTVTVNSVNDAPVAVDDTVVLLEDSNVDINVAGNDSDVDGTLVTASLTVVTQPSQGAVSLVNGMFRYTPNQDFDGQDSFTYTINDSEGSSSNVASVAVTVQSVNDAPLANDDEVTTDEDTSVEISVLTNDQDIDGTLDETSITLVQPTNGSVEVNAGVVTYTPALNFNGNDSFSYTVNDDSGDASNSATVTVVVTSVNDVPVISGSPATTVLEGASYGFTPTLSDVEGDTLTVSASGLPGWLSLNTLTGELSGSPVVGDAGVYADIVLQVSDGQDSSDLTAFSIEVIGDNDLDSIADSDDVDDDNDGMEDTFELAHNLNPLDASDAGLDSDSDGLTNLEEAQQGSNPQVDDQAPEFNVLTELNINATGLLTTLPEFTVPVAVDALDGDVSVELGTSLSSSVAPGRYLLTWLASDAAGNQAETTQVLNVHPQISLSKDQTVGEGVETRFRVLLNGESPTYPLTVSFDVAGTADTEDHDLVDGSVTFEDGETSKTVTVNVVDDGVLESSETILVALTGSGNLGTKQQHTITIVEENVAPQLVVTLNQNGDDVLIVTQEDGLVNLTATVTDPNPNDEHTLEWTLSGGIVTTALSDQQIQFDPTLIDPGLYQADVRVSDNGAPVLSNETRLSFVVIAQAPNLSTTQDTDGDGISDADEGLGDNDQDGQPDYLDAISLPNVLNEEVEDGYQYLIEGDPGVRMSLGQRAIVSQNGGAKLDNNNLPSGFRLPGDSVSNSGGYFDFVANDLPEIGQSVNIVIPQRVEIPENAIYRKFDNGVWYTFVEDANNAVMSAPGAQGACPPPESTDYRAGLNAGDWCVQLTIEDGGPNDADGMANGSIEDPGGVGILQNASISSTGSGGGSFNWSLLVILMGWLMYSLNPKVSRNKALGTHALSIAMFSLSLMLLSLHSQADEAQGWGQKFKERGYFEMGFYQATSSQSRREFSEALESSGVITDLKKYDTERLAYNLNVGYRYLDWSAIEVGFMDLGDVEVAFDSLIVNQKEFEEAMDDHYPVTGHGWTVGNRFEHKLMSRWLISGELGLFFWEGDIDISGADVESKYDDEQDPYLGFATHYELIDSIGVGVKWRRVFMDGQRIDLLGASLLIGF